MYNCGIIPLYYTTFPNHICIIQFLFLFLFLSEVESVKILRVLFAWYKCEISDLS